MRHRAIVLRISSAIGRPFLIGVFFFCDMSA
jgi:hypothetical protein